MLCILQTVLSVCALAARFRVRLHRLGLPTDRPQCPQNSNLVMHSFRKGVRLEWASNHGVHGVTVVT